MEDEKVQVAANEDKGQTEMPKQTEDVVGDLIKEAKEEAEARTADSEPHTNGQDVAEKKEQGKDGSTNSKVDTASNEKSSDRVREGQRWNDRPRKSNDRNDRKPYRNDNKRAQPFYKTNNKSDLESQEESSDPVAIRKQVEFYFSDSNLLQDKFLFTKVEGPKNLPVPLEVIHSFKRMRHFQPLSAVIDALKASATLNLVEEDTCVQRKEALPEGLTGKPMVEIQKVHEDKSMARSIYAKGFGEEGPQTQFDVEAFFAEFGATNSVRLRRILPEQTFKGSVFVEFDSEATQKSFLALDPKPLWQGKALDIKSKKQYCDEKVDDIQAGKIRPNEQEDPKGYQNKGYQKDRRDGSNSARGGRSNDKDDRDWKTRREEDQRSGFRDRTEGKHRGFGSSGRGGRGGRGGRNPRDRNDERNERDDRGVPKIKAATPESITHAGPSNGTPQDAKNNEQISPKVQDDVSKPEKNGGIPANTNTAPADPTLDTVAKSAAPDEGSKKRPREEDDPPEDQGASKKVDTKGAD